jgi:hypothetical protein
MPRNLLSFSMAFLVPLIPAVVLFWLFSGMNLAEFSQAGEIGVKLGGPAALYVVVVLIAFQFAGKLLAPADPLQSLKTELVGRWDMSSRSGVSGTTATSTCAFTLDEGDLRLSGGQFVTEGKESGTWKPDKVFLGQDGLAYLYELTVVGAETAEWRGLVDLNFDRQKGKLSALRGTWRIVGPKFHSGVVTFLKRKD